MSDLLELLLDLAINMLGAVAEAWLGDFSWPDTLISRIVLGVILFLLGGYLVGTSVRNFSSASKPRCDKWRALRKEKDTCLATKSLLL